MVLPSRESPCFSTSLPALSPALTPKSNPKEGKISQAQTLWDLIMVWRMTTFGKILTQNAVWGLEKVGLVPKGTHAIGEELKIAGSAPPLHRG